MSKDKDIKMEKNNKDKESKSGGKKRTLGIGVALRQTREKKRWSLDRLASKTKIKADYLKAMEEEEFDKLGPEIYLRLFLRSYAKELGLDGGKFLKTYQDHLVEQQPSPEQEEERQRRARQQTMSRVAVIAVAVLVVVGLVGGLVVRWNLRPEVPRLSEESLDLARDIVQEGAAHFWVRGLSDTWLQVVENDVNNTVITLKKGEIRSWRTTGSLKYKVGNAYGLEAEWQGKPLGALGAHGQVASGKLSVSGEED